MRLSKILMMIAAAGTLTISVTAPAHAEIKGSDRSGSQCVRKEAGKADVSGSCGTVCKDKTITTATGEDQASGYQYTCTASRSIVQGAMAVNTLNAQVLQQAPKTPKAPGVSVAPIGPKAAR